MKKLLYIGLVGISYSLFSINYAEERDNKKNSIVRLKKETLRVFKDKSLGDIQIEGDKKLKDIPNLVLNLSDNDLTAFPQGLEGLSNLIKLDLSQNKFVTLPSSISKFKKLTELDLSKNKLIQIPASIGTLQNLHQLILTDNNLTSLPTEIEQLSQLRILDAQGNPLQSVPNIGELLRLTILRFDADKLQKPYDIEKLALLPALKTIDIQNKVNVGFAEDFYKIFDDPYSFLHINPSMHSLTWSYVEEVKPVKAINHDKIKQKVKNITKLFELPMSQWDARMAPITAEGEYNVLDLTDRVLKDITGIDKLNVWDFSEKEISKREKSISEISNLYIKLNHIYTDKRIKSPKEDLPNTQENKNALIAFIKNVKNLKRINLPDTLENSQSVRKALKEKKIELF